MRFSLEHRFSASVEVVTKIANSSEFQELIEKLPNVGDRKVTSFEAKPDGSIHRVTKYSLGAQLPAPVVAVLGSNATWDEIADFDPDTHRWTFTIKPHATVISGRLDCKGSYAFEPDGTDRTKRVVDVDIKVKVPLVGGRAEREIKKGLVETMEAEAELLETYLQR